MPTLFLKCHECHQEFPTPIGVAAEAMGGFIISGITHPCPLCKAESEYVTRDYHFPEAPLAEPGDASLTLPVDGAAEEATYEKGQADRYVPVLDVADVPAPTGRFDEMPISQGN
jgi:hypothetical protein